ncbi:hypothetical protein AB8U03_15425 [Clostridium sp. Mt-5]|uniref:Uncharacterized protein n=1 Tax=Clostridium moutaii TaxID=3240932 RepID=A0ABV4BS06_9CLOT
MGLRKWDNKKITKLKKYWLLRTNAEIGKILGMSAIAVSKKACSLGLPDKRKMSRNLDGVWYNPDYTLDSKNEEYGPRLDTIKEIKGRLATEKLKTIKKNFKLGDVLKLIDHEAPGNSSNRNNMERSIPVKKHGKVIGITNYQVVVQRKNYPECFKFVDILSGKTIVEGLNVCS